MTLLQIQSELDIFKRIIAPRSVLEIGYFDGGTARYFDDIGAKLIVSVDNALATPCTPILTKGTLKIVIGDSHSTETYDKVKNAINNIPVDLLFIDGAHGPNDAYKDYMMYSPLVKGAIAFHDINEPNVAKDYNIIISKSKRMHIEIFDASSSAPNIQFHGIGIIL